MSTKASKQPVPSGIQNQHSTHTRPMCIHYNVKLTRHKMMVTMVMMMIGPTITAMMTNMSVSLDSLLVLGSGSGGLTVTVA